MRKDFQDFMQNVKIGIASGAIKLSKPIDDYDLLIMYAVGKIGERRSYPYNATLDEIYDEAMKIAPELVEN